MSLVRFTTSASLAILALPALYAVPRCPGNVVSLTLRLVQSSLIIVPVEINHSGPYDFLVDTGAQITTVDSSLAVNLGLKAPPASAA
jgi:Aspartyl protease